LPRLAEVFRRLIEEQVSLRNMRQLLEAVAEWAPREKNTAALTEYVRVGLRQQICQRSAAPGMLLPVLLVEDELAAQLAQDLHDTITGPQLRPENPDRLVEQVRAQVAHAPFRPVLVTTMDLRRPLWDLLSRYGLNIPVLSHPEIAPGFRVEVVGSIGVERRPPPRAQGMRAIPGGAHAGELKSA
jgi:type III secretion protein V